MIASKRRRTLEKIEDCDSIFICEGEYRYEILAATLLVRSNQPKPDPHDGEWEAIVTIYKTSKYDPSKAQSFPDHPKYGATKEEARKKGHDYGQKLVQRTVEGLKDYMT